jgi:hypothetical protein
MTKATLKSILQNYVPTTQERHCYRWLIELYNDDKIDEGSLNKRLAGFVADNNAEIRLLDALISVRTQLEMQLSGDSGLYDMASLKQKAAATCIEKARYFTYDDVVSYCGSRHVSRDMIRKYLKAGRIKRLERGAYTSTEPLPTMAG